MVCSGYSGAGGLGWTIKGGNNQCPRLSLKGTSITITEKSRLLSSSPPLDAIWRLGLPAAEEHTLSRP